MLTQHFLLYETTLLKGIHFMFIAMIFCFPIFVFTLFANHKRKRAKTFEILAKHGGRWLAKKTYLDIEPYQQGTLIIPTAGHSYKYDSFESIPENDTDQQPRIETVYSMVQNPKTKNNFKKTLVLRF